VSLVDLLVTILVATILITVGIGLVTYLVYKLRHARVRTDDAAGPGEDGRYFEAYAPPGDGAETAARDAEVEGTAGEPAGAESHGA